MCVHKRDTTTIMNYPVSYPSTYLYPYFSPLFPNYKYIRKVPIFTILAQHVIISRRQRHYFKKSLLRLEPQVLISSPKLLPFSSFYVSLPSPSLLPVLIEAACTRMKCSLIAFIFKQKRIFNGILEKKLHDSSSVSVSRGKYTDFLPLKSIAYFCEPTWNSKVHRWIWKRGTTSAEVIGAAHCSGQRREIFVSNWLWATVVSQTGWI